MFTPLLAVVLALLLLWADTRAVFSQREWGDRTAALASNSPQAPPVLFGACGAVGKYGDVVLMALGNHDGPTRNTAVWAWNVTANSVTMLPGANISSAAGAPSPRFDCGCAASGDAMWVAGGKFDNSGTSSLPGTFAFDVEALEWRTDLSGLVNVPPARFGTAAAASPSGASLLLYGGRDNGGVNRDELFLINTAAGTGAEIVPVNPAEGPPQPVNLAKMAFTAADTAILFGGYFNNVSGTFYSADIFSFSVTPRTWGLVAVPSSPIPGGRMHGWLFPVALGRVWIGYGVSSNGFFDNIYLFQTASAVAGNWTEIVASGPAPSARYGSVAVPLPSFDPAYHTIAVYGGYGGTYLDGAFLLRTDTPPYAVAPAGTTGAGSITTGTTGTSSAFTTNSPSVTTGVTTNFPASTTGARASTTGTFGRTTTTAQTTGVVPVTLTTGSISRVSASDESTRDAFPFWVLGVVAALLCCIFVAVVVMLFLRRRANESDSNSYLVSAHEIDGTEEDYDSDSGSEPVYDQILKISGAGGDFVPARDVATEGAYASLQGISSIEGPYAQISAVSELSTAVRELSPDQILVDRAFQLGKGNYGDVFKGVYRSNDGSEDVQVAVKMLKTGFSDAQLRSFFEEADIVARIPTHEFVVGFLGATPSPFMLVTELCQQGSLYSFLRRKNTSLSVDQCVKVLRDVAVGMAHLAVHNIVHRDLAARNILLTEDMVPKISEYVLMCLGSRLLTRINVVLGCRVSSRNLLAHINPRRPWALFGGMLQVCDVGAFFATTYIVISL
jgi:Protein tyrosine and serine/threonine kinase